MTNSLLPPSPVSGGIFLSYKCNATCKHCIYASSPRWLPDWIQEKNLTQILIVLADKIHASPYGPKSVSLNHGLHFTGGEPFLNFPLLLKGVEIANDLGIPSLFVETNAFWCQSDNDTLDKMQHLKAAGLSGMLVSVNPFILETVPFQRTARAIRFGSKVFGQGLIIYQLDYFKQFRKLGIVGRLPLEEYLQTVGLQEATSRIELLPIGRVVYRLHHWFRTYPASAFSGTNCAAEFSRTFHNHWDNYGNVIPGFCAGIALGNLDEQPTLYDDGLNLEQDYPLLKLLFEEGVEGLFRFAQVHFSYKAQQAGYISQCHLCVDIRKHLVSQTQEFQELRPLMFYERIG